MIKKIQNRIAFYYSLLVIMMVAILYVLVSDMVRNINLETVRGAMAERARLIDVSFRLSSRLNHEALQDRDLMKSLVKDISDIINLRVTVADNEGKVVADSSVLDLSTLDNHRYRKEILAAFENGSGESIRHSNTLNVDMFYYAFRSGQCVIRIAEPLNYIENTNSYLKKVLAIISFLLVAGGLGTTLLISRHITRPIMDTISFAGDFSKGEFSRRIHHYRDDEIGMLQKSLNTLADTIVGEMDALTIERQKLAVTLDNIHDGIAVIDTSRRIVISNQSFNVLSGITVTTPGRLYFEVIRSSSFNSTIEYSLSHGQAGHFEESFTNDALCEVRVTPIREEKTLQGILVVLHDVTAKRRIDRIKTELVGNLSHELKTPIAILRGYIETIRDHLDEPVMCAEMIRKSLVNVERQNSIINDMLKLNRIETGGDVVWEDVNLEETIRGCVDLLSSKAQDRKIVFECDIDSLDLVVSANRFLAEEVFFNIIDNAISYNNPGGHVHITGTCDKAKVRISITDTGIGIPHDSISRIFERFYRVDKGRSRETGGTGLGLSIVKHAAEILGWELNVSSGAGGSEFTVCISVTGAKA